MDSRRPFSYLIARSSDQTVIHSKTGMRARHGTSKVSEFEDSLTVDQNVGRFHIKVNDSSGMTVDQS